MEWIDLHGRHHGQYWLFKSRSFSCRPRNHRQHIHRRRRCGQARAGCWVATELSLEELGGRTEPAVVCLKAFDGMGPGFFVTDTGVIATNAQVARGDSTLTAVLPSGAQLPARVVFINPDLDIALVKACSS